MPYVDKAQAREHNKAYVRDSQCPKCGCDKFRNASLCRKCYDKARRPSTGVTYTDCPECGGRMKAGREKCTNCVTNERVGTKVRGGADRIRAFLACSEVLTIKRSDLVFCYYWRQRRMNILAKSRTVASKHVQTFYGGDMSEVIQSVCRISDININLTSVDLSQFNGAST
jgi:hypothetical protein